MQSGSLGSPARIDLGVPDAVSCSKMIPVAGFDLKRGGGALGCTAVAGLWLDSGGVILVGIRWRDFL